MNRSFRIGVGIAVFLISVTSAAIAQQVKRTPFDVTNYRMEVTLDPVNNKLAATVDVNFTPLEDTRSVTFELNGSLKVESVDRISGLTPPTQQTARTAKAPQPSAGRTQVTFIQDPVGVTDGPNVRIDLGENIAKGNAVTLRFKYSGVLNTPEGGPLLSKRLAYIGPNEGYLMYAARWFPFHDYASDLATADITVSVPAGLQVVGSSDMPVTVAGGKHRFVNSRPGLIGNLAYGKFISRTLKFGEYELQFNTLPGSDTVVQIYGETIGKAFEHYTRTFGKPDTGTRYVVAQIDDESLDFYTAPGMLFISTRQFDQVRGITEDRLQREVAFQWWGQTVGLKSFDDAWLSQGLAEYSAFSLRETEVTGAKLDDFRRELLEKSLTFEQTASLLRTPGNLDDQSTAYQYIMYSKGAFVFKLLRDTLGKDKFNELLKTYLNEYRGKRASIDDFEKMATRISGQNMRYFFARWVEGTGVPEFTSDYLIIRTRGGKFVARGTVKQNYDNLKLPVDVQLRSEGEGGLKTVTLDMDDSSADFNIESEGKPLTVVIDPGYKLLRISPDLRVSAIARRGIEQMKEGKYAEAQTQFEEALKLDRSNAWIYYHLGLLFLEQRNYDVAIENFKATRDLGAQGSARPGWLYVWSEIKMGNAYDAKGDRARATAAYGRAAKLGDDYDSAQEAIKKFQATPYDPRDKSATAVR